MGGTLTLSGASTYSGKTTVNSATILKLGADNAIPASSDVDLFGTLDLNGHSTSIGGLNQSGVVTNNAASAAGALTITAAGPFTGAIQNGTNAATSLTVNLLSGTLDLSNTTLTIHNFTLTAGTMTAPGSARTFSLDGDFTNNGTFTAGNGTVFFIGTGTQTIGGTASTTFNNLSDTVAGATLRFGAGLTTTVSGTLTLGPSSGTRLKLRSTALGTSWLLNPTGTTVLNLLDVQDSNNTATNVLCANNSIDSGNNNNWAFLSAGALSYDAPAAGGDFTFKASGGNLQILNSSNVEVFSHAMAGITSVTFNGTNNVANQLTLDYTTLSNTLPITFNGAASLTADQELILSGGSFNTDTYTYSSLHIGTVQLGSTGALITYTNLTPLTNTGTAQTIVFNLPSATTTATLDAAGVAGSSQLTSPDFETTTFANPTGSLTINHTSGTATITTAATFSAGGTTFNTGLNINGTSTDTINLNTLNLSAAGSDLSVKGQTINVQGSPITTTGNQTYNSPVMIASNATVTSTASGNITFGNTVQSTTAQSLTVNTSGVTTFAGAVGGGGNPLGALTTNAGGSTQINGGAITTTGTQNYNAAVTLGGNTTLNAVAATFGANLTLGATAATATDTLAVTGNLTLAPGSTFTTKVNGTTAGTFGQITTTGTATLTGSTLAATGGAGLTGGTLALINAANPIVGIFTGRAEGSTVTLNGIPFTISYLSDKVALTSQQATVVYVDQTFAGTPLGNNPATSPTGLTLQFGYNAYADIQSGLDNLASGGTIVIFADSTAYAGFTVSNQVAEFDINQNPQNSSGTGLLVIGSPVTLNQNVVFTQAAIMPGATSLPGADLEFDGNIDAGGAPVSLTINGNANFVRFEAIGTTNPLSFVDIASSSQVTLQQDVTTTTTQNYNAPVRVEDAGTATLTGTTITFDDTLQTNARSGGLVVAGNAVFDGVVGGGGNPLPSLQVNGTTAINTTAVTTSGTQTYADVTPGQTFTILTGVAVNFHAGLILGSSATTATSTLQIAGTVNFTSTSTVTSTFAGTAPAQIGHIIVGGGNTTYGNATLVLNYSGFTPAAGDAFDVVSNGGFGVGQFVNAPPPGPATINGVAYLVAYSGSTGGGDFILTAATHPAITSANQTTFTFSQAGSFIITTTGSPSITITIAGALPSGVTFVDNGDGTATLSGTPTLPGVYTLTLTASNGVPPTPRRPSR